MNDGDNGQASRRVALYLRVSTMEQAKHGLSLDDQRRQLESYVEQHGCEIVATLVDDGYSGANPDRPGLNRVMELAESGAIDVVVATKRDRLFRSRLYRLLFDKDLGDLGVRAIALNDSGNILADGFQDDFSDYEREQITQRTVSGKREAARQGRILATSHSSRFGFRYTPDRRAYLVDEDRMEIVRKIFGALAQRHSLYSVVQDLNQRGILSPRAGAKGSTGFWTAATLRDMIRNPVYEPHPYDEVAALVTPEVASRLDENGSYGLWYFGDIPVPVPDSGIPRQTVLAAREGIKHNRKASNAGHRTWALSGGVLKCARCGANMTAHRTVQRGKPFHYYRCPYVYQRGIPDCPNRKMLRAEEAEELVWSFVSDLIRNPEFLLRQLDASIEAKKAVLSSNLDKQRRFWAGKVVELDEKKTRAQDLAVDGLIGKDELRTRLDRIALERATAQGELENAGKGANRIKELEAEREVFPESLIAAAQVLDGATPQQQMQTYKDLNLSFRVEDGRIVNVAGDFERFGMFRENEDGR